MNKKQAIVLLGTIGVFISVFVYATFFRKTELVSDIRKDQELQVEWEVVSGCTQLYDNGTTTRMLFSIEVPSSIEVDKQSLSQKCIGPSNSDIPTYNPGNFVFPSMNTEVFSALRKDMKYLIFIKKDTTQDKTYNLFFVDLVNKTSIKLDSYSFSNEITELQKQNARYLRSHGLDVSEQILSVLHFVGSEMFRVEGDKYIVYAWYPKNSIDNFLTVEKVVDMKGRLVFQPNCDIWEPINFNTDLSRILYSCEVILSDSSSSVSYHVFDFVNTFDLKTPYPPVTRGFNYVKFVGTSTIEFFTESDEISKKNLIENVCTTSRYYMDIDGGNLRYMGRAPACF